MKYSLKNFRLFNHYTLYFPTSSFLHFPSIQSLFSLLWIQVIATSLDSSSSNLPPSELYWSSGLWPSCLLNSVEYNCYMINNWQSYDKIVFVVIKPHPLPPPTIRKDNMLVFNIFLIGSLWHKDFIWFRNIKLETY